MKEHYIADFNVGETVTEFYMVKSAVFKTGSNGKQYLDMLLGDCSGEIAGKKWDIGDDEASSLTQLKEGDLVKIRGVVTEWNGSRQLRIGKLRRYDPAVDQLVMKDYVKAAPEPAEDMYEYIMAKAISIKDEDLKAMACKFLQENKEHLLYWPGAMRNHHAEMAGLLYHIKRMLMLGEKACDIYTFLKKDWVICGVILHDMEKLNELLSNEMGVSPGYSFEGKLLGHIAQGVKAVEKMGTELGIPEEKKIMLQHMILSHHYEPDFGSPVKPVFPEAEILHYLDMLDAKLFDFEDALAPVKPGEFSERVRTLDGRMLYKPTF
ncbi:MAG: HD domain-containing protein [Ruminiclostridium sp.]|nr:HD domain-containing protein [Ruminiclostridium sp.]MCF0151558.1 HD domain-containing protein [Bacillota bacterium]